ncbi:MAG: glycine--tRNA ligase subunit beta [Anaerolineales bacterium]|nr:glycine--tRNA ligase subunit beta [Anaerolineales bacterium]
MSDARSFQSIILRLLAYWKDRGCLVQQPYNVQVGAGTMNPATSLRVLGPEPWNVVYVEPSIRPDDGRFGDNPNRMQMHHQLQVILKPDPGNPQELYLKSLEAIGIDPRRHDIRFVEDRWESPALGAWGLGWEVWLDGQEITQFTYFQQAGGHTLDPVSVEITYGLDRIVLALQGVNSVWELEYGAGIAYGDVLLQSEIEHCRYYFEVADVDGIRAVYDIYEREALHCLDANLILPAHDYNLKCSHLFNVLDTRGAIGVTERANYFRRMRNVARRIADLYVEQRQRLEFPLLPEASAPSQDAQTILQFAQSETPHTLLLEIGSEELPVGDLASAIKQLQLLVPEMLDKLRLQYSQVEVLGTPRRLSVLVHRLHGRQQDLDSVVKGPPADRAFDADGNPTKAAVGFARSRGLDVADLQVVEEGGKRYVSAVVRETGQLTAAVLKEALPDLIASLKFEKSIRWNQTNIAFSRPLRWIVAMYGPDVIPFTYAGVLAGSTSRGLRPYGSPLLQIDDAANYAVIMRRNDILLDTDKRKERIVSIGGKLAAEKGGHIPEDIALLDEVANLVEKPTPLRGQFEERFLALPSEVLVAVMRKHQRYFPVYDAEGKLMPYFIAVRNGDERHLDSVIDGNEHVIRARFADAEFFYKNDVQHKLPDFLQKLDMLTFQADLGSMLDKTHRLEKLTPIVAEMSGLTEAETAVANRAATLAKADLATKMVVEMTSLQGIMGAHYARLSGETEDIAEVIARQYDAVSKSGAGMALAIADRLDSLVGLFAAGLAPKGSNDPFALRRAALQLIENLVQNEMPFDLRAAATTAASFLPTTGSENVLPDVLAFIAGRLDGMLREEGFATSIVKAVLAEQGHNPYGARQAALALQEVLQASDWQALLDGFARCVRITRNQTESFTLRPNDFTLAAEKDLYAAYETAVNQRNGSVDAFISGVRQLLPAITRFFDDVLVMDEDQAVRENRLALLQHIAALGTRIVDLSYLEGF